jgi:hypothetical protein
MAHRAARGAIAVRRTGDGGTSWWIAFVALVILVAGAGTWTASKLLARPQIDAVSLCPADGPVGVKAILLDLTDPLQPSQAARLATLLEREIAASPTHTMISIGVVSEFPENWGSHFARCKPATGESANSLYQNPALIAASFDREFSGPLRATLTRITRGATENRSPIMEGLQTLLAETPHALEAGENLSIVIASDMLQHSDALSLYRGEDWDHLVATGASDRLARNLRGAELSLILIPRPEVSRQARSGVDAFWARYFDQQGVAAPFDVTTLGDL